MKSDNQRRAESDARKRAQNKFKLTTWADESWRGTEALETLKKRLYKERVK